MSHISGKSAKVHQEIRIKGSNRIVADADITFVIIDNSSQKVLPIKGNLHNIIDSLRD